MLEAPVDRSAMSLKRQPRVALIGVKGVGKTTLAQGMEQAGFARMSLAGPVKDTAFAAVETILHELGLPPISREQFDRDKSVFRPLLQWLGTDLVRDYCAVPTFWINRLLERANASTAPVVVDDVRFGNEVESLRAAGFRVWKIVRPDMDTSDQHASETFAREFRGADLVIANAWSADEHRQLGLSLARQIMANAGMIALEITDCDVKSVPDTLENPREIRDTVSD